MMRKKHAPATWRCDDERDICPIGGTHPAGDDLLIEAIHEEHIGPTQADLVGWVAAAQVVHLYDCRGGGLEQGPFLKRWPILRAAYGDMVGRYGFAGAQGMLAGWLIAADAAIDWTADDEQRRNALVGTIIALADLCEEEHAADDDGCGCGADDCQTCQLEALAAMTPEGRA